jgi:hypothetical protein
MVFEIGSNETSANQTITSNTITPDDDNPPSSFPSTLTRTGTLSIAMIMGSTYSRAGVGAFTGGGLTGTISENGSFGTNAAFNMSASIGANQNWVIDSASKSSGSDTSTSTITTSTQNWSGPSGEFFAYNGSEVIFSTNRSSSSNASQQSLQGGGSWGGTTTTAWSTLINNDIRRNGSGEYRGVRTGLPVTGSGTSDYRMLYLSSLSSTQVRDLSGGLINDSGSGIISTIETSQWNASGGGAVSETIAGASITSSGPGYNTSHSSTTTNTLSMSESSGGSTGYSDVTLLASVNGSLQPISRQYDQSGSITNSTNSTTLRESSGDYTSASWGPTYSYDSNSSWQSTDRRSGTVSQVSSSFTNASKGSATVLILVNSRFQNILKFLFNTGQVCWIF